MSGSNIITGTLDLVILRILAGGAQHGYAVGRTIRERSEGVLAVEEGVLYPALHRLEERGLLRSKWRRSESNRRAKYYSLTPAGRRALSDELRRWREMTGAVAAVLRESEAT
jgi:PadR family transcriptional regulator PadR